jgi:urease accessory protein UreF
MPLQRIRIRTPEAKLESVVELREWCAAEADNTALQSGWRATMRMFAKRLELALADDPRPEPTAPLEAGPTPAERQTLKRLARELRDTPNARGARLANVPWRGSDWYVTWIERFLHAEGPPTTHAVAEALLVALLDLDAVKLSG